MLADRGRGDANRVIEPIQLSMGSKSFKSLDHKPYARRRGKSHVESGVLSGKGLVTFIAVAEDRLAHRGGQILHACDLLRGRHLRSPQSAGGLEEQSHAEQFIECR